MSLYQYSDESVVSSLRFHFIDGKPSVALLQAGSNATSKEIMMVRQLLAVSRMPSTPVNVDDKQMLQVEDFGSVKALVEVLKSHGFIRGNVEIAEIPSDHSTAHKTPFFERYSLKIAGVLNLIGDVAMHAGGYGEITGKVLTGADRLDPLKVHQTKVKGYFDLAGGGLYTLGGLNLIAYANSKNEAPPLAERTDAFIKQTLNPDAPSNSIAPEKKPSFLRERAADVTLGAYMGGAGVFLGKGMYGLNISDQKKWSDVLLMGYGATSLAFKTLALKIKEDPNKDKDCEDSPKKGSVAWFTEKPMRIFGYGSFLVDSLYTMHSISDFKEWRNKPLAVRGSKIPGNFIFKGVTSATYLASDYLAAISSKNVLVDPLTEDQKRMVTARAAEAIAAQPVENQEVLVKKISGYLGQQAEMCENEQSSRQRILEQTQSRGKNPWAVRFESPEDGAKAITI